jgi:rhodanese-related sulfurtransferase
MLVDVRAPEELSGGSISGSRLIPFSDLAQGRQTLPAGRPLLLICAVGGRSYAVGRYFSGKGYGEIYNLAGGISAWKAAGLPLQPR